MNHLFRVYMCWENGEQYIGCGSTLERAKAVAATDMRSRIGHENEVICPVEYFAISVTRGIVKQSWDPSEVM